jgi:5-methylcytosine-specific restriction endonuclease McrA
MTVHTSPRFTYPEDEQFFRALLCDDGETLDRYIPLFDFRSPTVKRQEFNRSRDRLLAQLIAAFGPVCQLQFAERCSFQSGIAVDHLIPLSTNKLNKELRALPAAPGKKVVAQSFGANRLANLVVACANCNSFKKHRLLERAHLKRLLAMKGFC